MKKYIFLLFFSISFELSAQNNIVGAIEYRHILNLNPAAPSDDEGIVAILYFGAFKSNYIYNQINYATNDTVRIKKKETKGGMTKFIERDSVGNRVFKDLLEKSVVHRHVSFKKAFLIEETLPTMIWEIKPEQKKIGSLLCQKALTRYRGRNYEAWFTLSIPVSTGPWKFNGLPGLIVEVFDDTHEVQFLYNNISFVPFNTTTLLEKPYQGLKATWQEIDKFDNEETMSRQKKFMSTAPKGITEVSFRIQKPKLIELDE